MKTSVLLALIASTSATKLTCKNMESFSNKLPSFNALEDLINSSDLFKKNKEKSESEDDLTSAFDKHEDDSISSSLRHGDGDNDKDDEKSAIMKQLEELKRRLNLNARTEPKSILDSDSKSDTSSSDNQSEELPALRTQAE